MATPISRRVAEIVSNFREGLRSSFGARLVSLFLAVAPVPASRPRVTRFGGVYYGAPYKRFFDAAKALLIGGAAGPLCVESGPVVLLAEIVAEKPRTGKLDYPRGDVDNFLKGPVDALTHKTWDGRPIADDNQIVGMIAFKRYAELGEEPGVRIDYAPLV